MLPHAVLERPREAALIEGLQQVVHHAVLEAAQRPVDVVHARHEDDGHVGMPLLHLLEEPEAIVFRHLHVAERDAHAALVGDLQGFIGAGDRQRMAAVGLHPRRQHLAHAVIVVDDEDRRGHVEAIAASPSSHCSVSLRVVMPPPVHAVRW